MIEPICYGITSKITFSWYKNYIFILKIQFRIILHDVPLLKYPIKAFVPFFR
ncbi:hypothetical protein RO3G_10221 [Rhizopus delemar RA 99-880]|uniref:Uncharacterized protein n=1 Tax=Rhizopus delemar (strain RA 99-880 / ATCC MYA-4621 / FGSC 9543 / NRRL 43880) TaxID=246409 RepID=I1CAN1_RHIO9|nr:hypothetical protein RO3G_10221 [Rhizopus delemar RA 99-880]|eukprot:EIE85511.1 hypothetical protein RO3G_10221 [Rhizopus delemar RA 99-880]